MKHPKTIELIELEYQKGYFIGTPFAKANKMSAKDTLKKHGFDGYSEEWKKGFADAWEINNRKSK
jgi:hypothetical protein